MRHLANVRAAVCIGHDALPTPAPSILECLLSVDMAWAGTMSYLLQNGTGMRQENVLGRWEVTVTEGNVQALEPMGKSQLVSSGAGCPLRPTLWVPFTTAHPEIT